MVIMDEQGPRPSMRDTMAVILRQLVPINKVEAYRLLFCLFLMPLTSISSSMIPLLTAQAVDMLTTSDPTAASSFIIYICTIKVTSVLVGVSWFNLLLMHCMKCSKRAQMHGVAKLLFLDVKYLQKSRPGDTLKKIEQGGAAVQSFGTSIFGNVVPTCLQLFTAITVLLGSGAGLTSLAILISSSLYVVVTTKATLVLRRSQRRLLLYGADLHGEEVQSVAQAATIKAFGAEVKQIAKLQAKMTKLLSELTQMLVVRSAFTCLQFAVQEGGLAAALILASTLVASNEITPGGFVMVQMFVSQLFGPLTALATQTQAALLALSQIENWCDIVQRKPEVMDELNATNLADHLVKANHEHSVEFSNVHFLYSPSSPVALGSVSFCAQAGTSTALVGSSGSGKSTCFVLTMRFYDVASGCVKVCGKDVRHVSQQSLRSVVGLIPQETVLFNDSIANNVKMGAPHATEKEVHDTIERVHLTDFLNKYGLDAQLGERGAAASGGERQRIGIARTLLRDCHVLLLDEATSALDNNTEKSIQGMIDATTQGVTKITIAHRLTTIVNSDLIVVFHCGDISESGTHGALLLADGFYAKMWRAAHLK